MKVLVSWEAYGNDYDNGKPILEGPNGGFHQAFYEKQEFDKHILLSARKGNDQEVANKLVQYLQHTFESHTIELQCLPLDDVIDINEIKGVVKKLLLDLKMDDLTFFVSPGTPAMQVVWHLLHIELNDYSTQLVQTRRASDTKSRQAELVFIELEKSTIPTTLIQKEASEGRPFLRSDEGIFIGKSLEPIYADAYKIAQADKIPVLIQGPTGSGKEHLARFVHDSSSRKSKPFVPVNCSAFDDNLLLSELFGHEKGAFTGAIKDKLGLFEAAQGGSLFLDEIGDISSFTQQALLRAIQTGEIRPLGSNRVVKVDVRIISATHRNLKQLCVKEKFRWDLYYRLSTAVLELPGLLERGAHELKDYLYFIITRVGQEMNRPKLKLTKPVEKHLLQYTYPGNLREMHNIISTLYVYYENGLVDDFRRLPELTTSGLVLDSFDYEEVEAPFMKKHILKVIRAANGNISKAAGLIGWAPNTLRSNAEKVGIALTRDR